MTEPVFVKKDSGITSSTLTGFKTLSGLKRKYYLNFTGAGGSGGKGL